MNLPMRIVVAALLVAGSATLARAQESDLTVTKTGPEVAAAGSDVSYMVTITNLGPDPAAGVTLNDSIPAGMTFVSATQNTGPAFVCSTPSVGSGGLVSCVAPALAASESAQFTFVFQIGAAAAPGTFFTNVATASGGTFDPNSENDSGVATTMTPAAPFADLGVSKLGPGAAGPDTDVAFTITLINGGPSAASTATLQDIIPGDLMFVSLAQNSGPTLSCTTPAIGSGGTISCDASGFAAGASAEFTLTLHVPAGTVSGTEYTNLLSVTSSNDPNDENNTTAATIFISAVDVAITKSGPPAMTAGSNVTYVLSLSNAGPDPAMSASFSDVLPNATTFVSLTQDNGPAASCTAPAVQAAGTVACSIGILASGASADFTLVVAVGDATSITNSVTAATESFDVDTSDNSAEVTTAVAPLTDIVVTKSGPATATAGSNLTWIVTVTNAGPSTASTVNMTDLIPANTTFVSVTQTSGPTFVCTVLAAGPNVAVSCDLAAFSPGSASFSIVVNVVPSATGTISNAATGSTATPETDSSNNASTSESIVQANADLTVGKSATSTGVAGTNITYAISVSNAGPSDATNVTLNDTLPAGVTFVSLTQVAGTPFTCSTPAAGSTGTISCSAPSLPPSATAQFSLVVNISPTTSGSISNTATIGSSTPDANGANNSGSATTDVTVPLPIPALSPVALLFLATMMGAAAVLALRGR